MLLLDLLELVGFVLVAAFLVLMFHVWGVLGAGVLFVVLANVPGLWSRGDRS